MSLLHFAIFVGSRGLDVQVLLEGGLREEDEEEENEQGLKNTRLQQHFWGGRPFQPGMANGNRKEAKGNPKVKRESKFKGTGSKGGHATERYCAATSKKEKKKKKKCALMWAEKVCPKLHLFESSGNPGCVSSSDDPVITGRRGSERLGGGV